MTDLSALIAKLEAAPEGSRELSDEVLLAISWTIKPLSYAPDKKLYNKPNGEHWLYDLHGSPPHPTRSLDDCLAHVVPEGVDWDVGRVTGNVGYSGHVMMPCEVDGESGWRCLGTSKAKTPVLALAIAALKARQEMDDDAAQ